MYKLIEINVNVFEKSDIYRFKMDLKVLIEQDSLNNRKFKKKPIKISRLITGNLIIRLHEFSQKTDSTYVHIWQAVSLKAFYKHSYIPALVSTVLFVSHVPGS